MHKEFSVNLPTVYGLLVISQDTSMVWCVFNGDSTLYNKMIPIIHQRLFLRQNEQLQQFDSSHSEQQIILKILRRSHFVTLSQLLEMTEVIA